MTKEDEVKKQLKWRLSERPTVESIERLIALGVITKEEAKMLLLDEDEIRPKSLKDLENEIGLLRELVLDISKRQPFVINPIQIIERHVERYPTYPWTRPYAVFCSSNSTSNPTISVGTATIKNL